VRSRDYFAGGSSAVTISALFSALVLLAGYTSSVAAAERTLAIICQDGDKHVTALTETSVGTPGAHEITDIRLGPSKPVWLTLPDRASLSDGQTQPIPTPNLNADRIEVLVDYPGGRSEVVKVRSSDKAVAGAVETVAIRAVLEARSYLVPDNCRALAPAEQNDYALALLNNAGCLLPANMHERLESVPGAGGVMPASCGWQTDARLAMHSLKKSADLGSRDAGWILSQLYLGNADADLIDHEAALVRLSRTAGLGHASADLMTGIMRWRGDGLKTTPAAAFTTLLPHARRGSREAQGIVGTMYLTGQGVPENPVQAYAWCHLAAGAAPLMYSDPLNCRDAAEEALSFDEMLSARDLAVEIHHGQY